MGKWVVLREGDLVETSMLNKFVYDQGQNACSTQNKGKCEDDFGYVPFGEWTGYGEYQTTSINITPVLREKTIAGEGNTKADEPIELKKENAPVTAEAVD